MLNGILVVDKPEGITSHGVVSRLRRILGERRIGHGGTLDPMATGVLPVFIGRATRAAEYLLASEKAYTARFKLGITTDTQDITGTILSESDKLPAAGELHHMLTKFVGKSMQLPPMYSALKVGGRKLCEIARSGEEIERPKREIEIFSIDLIEIGDLEKHQPNEYTISVYCSKGTYIRTLVHDIGTALGCGAVLTALRRTRTGSFDISEAKTLEEIAASAEIGTASQMLIPVDALFKQYPRVVVDASGEKLCRCGALIPVKSESVDSLYRVYGPDGDFLMIGKAVSIDGNIYLKTVKNFFDVG